MLAKRYIRIIFWVVFVIFVLNKLWIRPWVLEQELPTCIDIFVLSLPNFIEAIMGNIIVTGILFRLIMNYNFKIKAILVYLLSTSFTAVYVISQEMGYHHIGGNNTYDIYDLWASIIGLVVMFGNYVSFGFLQKAEMPG